MKENIIMGLNADAKSAVNHGTPMALRTMAGMIIE